MKNIFILFLGLAISLNAAVVTKTSSKSATGEGYGVSYAEAVDNALAQAVAKLNGAYIKSSKKSSVNASKNNSESSFKKDYEQKISVATQGRFSSYEILEQSQNADGFRVVVQVVKTSTSKHYKIPGQNTNKHNIIVVPRVNSLNMMNVGYSELVFLDMLKTGIQNEIYKARKFNLLDRDNTGIAKSEENFIRKNSPKDEALRIGHAKGADYLFLFDVVSFRYKPGEVSPYTGTMSKSQLSVNVNYQVILLATNEIKYSNSNTITYDTNSANDAALNGFVVNISKKLVDDFHSGIYPPVVENISNGLAVFTQQLQVNTELECFSKGKVITDSRTKEKSYTEDFSGEVKIVRNNEKQSYGSITTGNVTKGNICRPKNAKKEKKASNGYGL